MESQRTFGDKVGMAPVVPTARLPLDLIECSDGTLRCHEDVWYDCNGGAHGSESDRHDADVQIVTDLLDGIGKWSDEYHTENIDYPNGYAYIVDEVSHDWSDRIRDWVESNCNDDDDIDAIVSGIVERMDSMDCEPEFSHNEYSAYDGPGVCLFSLDLGEIEEQIEVNGHDVLRDLHDEGRLDDVLDDVNCDVYVSRSKRRVKNETTGRYENVGRDTYNPYDRDNPTFEVYTNPGGQWHYVVSDERMLELLADVQEEIAGYTD